MGFNYQFYPGYGGGVIAYGTGSYADGYGPFVHLARFSNRRTSLTRSTSRSGPYVAQNVTVRHRPEPPVVPQRRHDQRPHFQHGQWLRWFDHPPAVHRLRRLRGPIAYFPSPGDPYQTLLSASQGMIYMIGMPSWVPGSLGGVAPATIASVTDGTSNTILFGEHAHNLNGPVASTATSTAGAGGSRATTATRCTRRSSRPTSSKAQPRIITRRRPAGSRGTAARPSAAARATTCSSRLEVTTPAGPTSPSSMARSISSRTPSTRGTPTAPPTSSVVAAGRRTTARAASVLQGMAISSRRIPQVSNAASSRRRNAQRR